MSHIVSEERRHQRFELKHEIAALPPDPESHARHRAQILVKSETLRIVLITMLEGASIQEHSAPGPITVQPIDGEFDFVVEGETQQLGVGDLIVVAPGVMHSVECRAEGAILLTIAHMSREPDQGGDSD